VGGYHYYLVWQLREYTTLYSHSQGMNRITGHQLFLLQRAQHQKDFFVSISVAMLVAIS